MRTEVEMKRELFGVLIKQKSKSEFFSATDMVKAGNKWRVMQKQDFFNMSEWLRRKSTKEFIAELEKEFGCVVISGQGRGSHTWVHPLLFIDMALAISPKLKIEVYRWLYDHLLAYRNSSGDSYKKMCGSLYEIATNKSNFPKDIQNVCLLIRKACGVTDWQKATEKQLILRDKIHNNISLLAGVMRNSDETVRLGILKAKEDVDN